MPATYKGPRNILVVKPDWVPSYSRHLYFSLRSNVGGVGGLGARACGGGGLWSNAWTCNALLLLQLFPIIHASMIRTGTQYITTKVMWNATNQVTKPPTLNTV